MVSFENVSSWEKGKMLNWEEEGGREVMNECVLLKGMVGTLWAALVGYSDSRLARYTPSMMVIQHINMRENPNTLMDITISRLKAPKERRRLEVVSCYLISSITHTIIHEIVLHIHFPPPLCSPAPAAHHRKLIPTPNCSPFLPSSPRLSTSGKLKFSSNLATGCA